MLAHTANSLRNSTAIRAFDSGAEIDVMLMRSKDSAAMVEYWDQTDCIVEGAKAIKLAGEKYLPKFDDEEAGEWQNRLKLTKFTNVYRDIVEGLASKPFEEETKLVGDSIPDEIKEFIENVDGSGNNLTVFSSLTFFNGINSAIDWIFVDYPKVNPEEVKTVADEKRAGIKPFWSHVLGRNVLEARVTMVNSKEQLSYIRILEPGEPDHVRIITRIADQVNWQLFKKTDKYDPETKTRFVLEDEGVISIGVIPLVPFMVGRRDGRTFKMFPAMRDAADLQIELYQQESGLKFIKTMAAYPMLAGEGVSPELIPGTKTPKKLKVGPARTLYTGKDGQGNHGTWKYVEPSAQSMTFLAGDVKETINQLRELGRQPLTSQSGNLTTITTAVAAGKAKSAVGAWALLLKDTLENALKITCLWLQNPFEPEVSVYMEFDDVLDDGKDLETLNKARENGDLSQETYWEELGRRKVLSPEFDAEKERQRLLAEVPAEPDLEEPDDQLPNSEPKPLTAPRQPEPQPGNVA
jgi:hypothetical protein